MTNEIFSNVANSEQLYAPIFKFNKLTVAKVEEFANIELASLREYTEIGLGQLRAAAQVSDLESFKAFTESQQVALKTVSEKLVSDAKAFAEVTESFRNEALEIARESNAELKVKAA